MRSSVVGGGAAKQSRLPEKYGSIPGFDKLQKLAGDPAQDFREPSP